MSFFSFRRGSDDGPRPDPRWSPAARPPRLPRSRWFRLGGGRADVAARRPGAPRSGTAAEVVADFPPGSAARRAPAALRRQGKTSADDLLFRGSESRRFLGLQAGIGQAPRTAAAGR